ncbi:MAG: Hpt domain-containing protein [SAR324 cluster bacterium]|uniref:Hpt domain-containing protein n=1 Tax=SAR324 cluster bacterium TaxID=2024889 RepID=A0A7X9IK93_9DELT|nr:Hpt domain-containing protein [SAR324 cluster bacterium]
MSEVLIFDKDGAVERVDGDCELLKELGEIFLEDFTMQLKEIQTAISKSDYYGLNRKAHSIKSALGNLGAMKAHATALEMELEGRNENFQRAPALLEELQHDVEEYFRELKIFLKEKGLELDISLVTN